MIYAYHDYQSHISLIYVYCQLYGDHTGHSYIMASDASKNTLDTLKIAGEGLMVDMEMLALSRKLIAMVVSNLARNRRHCERSVKKILQWSHRETSEREK